MRPFIEFYRRFASFKQGRPDTWVDQAADFFAGEARRKWKRFPAYCKALKRAFLSVPGFREGGIVEGSEPSVTGFVLKGFFPLVQRWFQLATGISPSNVALRDARVVYRGEAVYQIEMTIPAATFKAMDEAVFDFGELAKPIHVRDMVHLIFSKLVDSLNPILKTVANIEWQVVQLTNLLKIALDGMHVTVLISFNDYSGKGLQMAFFNGHLLDFIEDTLSVAVDAQTKNFFLQKKEDFHQLAKRYFNEHQEDMIGAIKHFEALALVTGRIDPLYEVLASLISKLDLGVTPVQQLLGEYNEACGLTEQQTIVWGYLFELVITQALLYETFQSNLAIFKEDAGQVFMLVLQYYLIDLGRDALSEKVFRGGELRDKIVAMASRTKGTEGGVTAVEDFSAGFQQFLVNHFKVQGMDDYDSFIRCLFGKSVERMNSRFFAAFLKTSHEQVAANIEKLNENVAAKHRLTFPGLVHRISDFLQFCLKRVFFKGDLALASQQFKDPVSRFSKRNIATAMVELLLYRELPFHENQWMATLAVDFRNMMDVAIAVDVRDGFKSISPGLLANFVTHDRALKPTTTLLHERLFNEVIEPFNAFHQFLRQNVARRTLDWESFVAAIARFFKSSVHGCKLDARAAQRFARIVAVLIDRPCE
ncbi:MAG: hypothetical protein JW839_18195 [Candidatus Lokiarchaeota archaeon]|nr:hypothetical protein [Candidatus Lokiarchaeota archaeon]